MSNHGSFDVMVNVHQEDGTWWAESDDWPGWTAAADTLEKLHTNMTESFNLWRPGIRWFSIVDPVFAPTREEPTDE